MILGVVFCGAIELHAEISGNFIGVTANSSSWKKNIKASYCIINDRHEVNEGSGYYYFYFGEHTFSFSGMLLLAL